MGFLTAGVSIGVDLSKSAKLELLRSQYERLNGQTGCWTCSPIIMVIGASDRDPKQACEKQKERVEAVKASFSSSYRVKIEEAWWLSLVGVMRSILVRGIAGLNRLHVTSDELSNFISFPKPITPSISYMPKKTVEFGALPVWAQEEWYTPRILRIHEQEA